MQRQYPLHAGDVLLQKTPIVFDVSVWELFWWSFLGASLCVLPPHAEKDPVQMINAVERNKVSVMHFVPSMLGVFLAIMEEDFDFKPLSTLRLVFSSGEALKPEHVNAFGNTLHKHAGTRLSNLYGPTEATVDVTYYDCDFESECTIVPIGKPIDNVRLYILDKNDRAMPVGVAGELCIAGIGLARGYLNNEALTNEKFNILSRLKERVYRTGDLARWLPDGNIEYLGRIDHQVKLRGFRIEMEEIEHCLNKHENIQENVVIPIDKEENKYLVAYYVSEHELSREELQQLLLCYLPEYMVPAFFVHMRQLPINSNGKLDRKALPAPDVGDVYHYTAPSDKMEEQLTDIWADILRIDKGVISVDRSFFELGGHSLKATLLINKINKVFGVDISITEIFNKPSVKSMAEHIDASLHQHGGVNQFENIVEIVI
jgi:acyl-coenzyme A synthetase/AMP-(fatty) acid ligase/acyl carrier protein